MWLCSIVTDIVLVKKQQEIEMLLGNITTLRLQLREKEGEL